MRVLRWRGVGGGGLTVHYSGRGVAVGVVEARSEGPPLGPTCDCLVIY